MHSKSQNFSHRMETVKSTVESKESEDFLNQNTNSFLNDDERLKQLYRNHEPRKAFSDGNIKKSLSTENVEVEPELTLSYEDEENNVKSNNESLSFDLHPPNLKYYPQYFYIKCFNIQTKKILIAYNERMEVKFIINNEKKSIEWSTFGFSNFFLQCDTIKKNMISQTKSSYKIDHQKCIKNQTRNNENVLVIEDTEQNIKISFTESEIIIFMELRFCFCHLLSKYVFNRMNVIAFYQKYVKTCIQYQTKSLESYHLNQLDKEFCSFPFDVTQLFFEIPIILKDQLEHDIFCSSLLNE